MSTSSPCPTRLYRPLVQKYRGWVNALLLCALLVSSACSRAGYNDPRADHSFVTGEPCEMPCWYGLELDKSTQQEIVDTLNSLPFVDASSVYTSTRTWLNDDNATAINFSCLHPEEPYCGAMAVSGDRFKFLTIIVGFPLTLETVVSKLGPPDYISSNGIVDSPEYILDLYWPEKNMQVSSRNSGVDYTYREIKTGKQISPNLLATEIVYAVKDSFSSLIEQFPWPGFSEP